MNEATFVVCDAPPPEAGNPLGAVLSFLGVKLPRQRLRVAAARRTPIRGVQPVGFLIVTTTDRGADGHRRRSQARLPRDFVERLTATAKANGHNASQLAHSWLLLSARHAKAGRLDLVPQHERIPSGTPLANLQWTQSAEESAECVRLLRDADTTVRAVLMACGEAYLDAGGSLLEMTWPSRRGLLVGAA